MSSPGVDLDRPLAWNDDMKALAIDARPSVGRLPQSLHMMVLPVPEPKRGEVRVRVEASAINVDDQHIAEGTMFGGFPVAPKPTPDAPWVPGTDLSGTIDALGPGVTGLEPGQRVYGLRPPKLAGPWAEYAVTRATHLAPIPEGWAIEQAGALCLAGMVIGSILDALDSPQGKLCLVVGASGSIGTMLVPALHHAGAHVWGVCSDRNRQLVERLGAEQVLDYLEAPFDDQVRHHQTELDAVIDLVGGKDIEARARSVTRGDGAFVTVVGPEKYVGERKLGTLGLTGMIGRIGWSWLRSRAKGPKYCLVGPLAPDFGAIERWLVSREIRPTIDRVVPFEQAAVREGLAYVASHRARGRVVIVMRG